MIKPSVLDLPTIVSFMLTISSTLAMLDLYGKLIPQMCLQRNAGLGGRDATNALVSSYTVPSIVRSFLRIRSPSKCSLGILKRLMKVKSRLISYPLMIARFVPKMSTRSSLSVRHLKIGMCSKVRRIERVKKRRENDSSILPNAAFRVSALLCAIARSRPLRLSSVTVWNGRWQVRSKCSDNICLSASTRVLNLRIYIAVENRRLWEQGHQRWRRKVSPQLMRSWQDVGSNALSINPRWSNMWGSLIKPLQRINSSPKNRQNAKPFCVNQCVVAYVSIPVVPIPKRSMSVASCVEFPLIIFMVQEKPSTPHRSRHKTWPLWS